MRRLVLVPLLLAATSTLHAQQSHPTIEQFLSAPEAMELTAANRADRVAWVTWQRGMRNVYTAAAPSFTPMRITSFLKDDGQEVGDVHLSDDGRIAVFVRGNSPNSAGWIANPEHDPNGSERAIWAASTAGGAWRLVQGSSPELSPDGRMVVYVKDGEIYRVRTARGAAQDSMDRGLKPFIDEWGQQSQPQFSPDGSHVAFVSNRGDHSFIGVYDVAKRKVTYASPSVDCDMSPTWSPDSKRIAFIRKPGVPFGMQPQIAQPDGSNGRRANGCSSMYGFRFSARADSTHTDRPGLFAATFADGSNTRILIVDVARMNADIASEAARVVWHNAPKDSVFTNVARIVWADADHIIFPFSPPHDEWDRYYSLNTAGGAPIMLTTTNGLIEDATSAALSRDRRTLYYSTNANDIERRHIWAVPVSGGTPRQLSTGDGVETSPVVLSSKLAVLYFGAKLPASVALVSAAQPTPRVVSPAPPNGFPVAAHVVPQIVIVKAPDSLDVHTQLFLPQDLKPGEKRPAIIFVHGGPMRQMLPAYHYMQFYHWAYAVNQWLASQGYVVLSVNYRLGVGYGRTFHEAGNKGGARGDAEYQDVLAAAHYLQTRPDVDAKRVGIWGLSYGGLLTAEALARNSDVFVAGVDMAGVHLWGNSLDTASVSYKSSPISAIDKWTSPVLLVQGDDDRNVQFSQIVGLVPLLRAHNVYHEVIIVPDDTHESLLYSRWIYLWNRTSDFLHRFVRDRSVPAQ